MRSRLALRLKTILDRSAMHTRLSAGPADVVKTFSLARAELKRKQAEAGHENKRSGVQ